MDFLFCILFPNTFTYLKAILFWDLVCRKKKSATNILEKEEVFMEHRFVVISALKERENLKNLIKLTESIRDIRMLD